MLVSRETNVLFVVEGKNDQAKLKQFYPQIQTVITNGSDVSDELLLELKEYAKVCRIILLLDPDGPGEKIRKIISRAVPTSEHVFVERNTAISKNKKKIGIEHMSKASLDNALTKVLVVNKLGLLTMVELYNFGLVGTSESKSRREYLCSSLSIGYANGKTLLSKLNMFNITKEKIALILEEL